MSEVRNAITLRISVASGGGTSQGFHVADFFGGTFLVPAGMTSTSVTIQGSVDGGNTWEAVREEDDSAVGALTVAAGETHRLPPAAFFYEKIRFVFGSNEAADRTIIVLMKS